MNADAARTGTAQPPIVALIATRGRAELLRRTLVSLGECRLPPSLREVVVVENGPRGRVGETVAGLRHALPLRYAYEPAANKSRALNGALADLSTELVVFFDDDIRIHPDTLAAYAEAAAGRDGGEFYGGRVGCDYEKPVPEWMLPIMPHCARGWSMGEERARVERPEFLGCNWAAFAGDMKRAGGFDPERGPGGSAGSTGQESEMQRRLLERGVAGIYLPRAMVWHHVTAAHVSWRWLLKRWYRMGVYLGLDMDNPPGGAVFGYPAWALQRMARKEIPETWRNLRQGDRAARARAVVHFAYKLGVLGGLRRRRRGEAGERGIRVGKPR